MNVPVVEAINRQVNSELSASYSYLAMSAWCEGQKFTGAARWLRLQSQEEYGHAMKLHDFVLARGGHVELKALPAPTQSFKSLHDIFDKVLKQEQQVSEQIDTLYALRHSNPPAHVAHPICLLQTTKACPVRDQAQDASGLCERRPAGIP